MSLHNFIFTKQTPSRFYRHIAFWLGRLLFSMFCFEYIIGREPWNWNNFSDELKFNSFNLVLAIVYCYVVVYYMYPKYLDKKKYLKFFTGVFVLTIIIYAVFFLVISAFWNLNSQSDDLRIVAIWHFSMYFITAGPPVVCCLFLLIKMLKNYYFQMEKKATLARENANAELQLLKAQVHPHFLFNTLNNIYSFILNKSPNTKGLITKLSDTLKYMINECEAALVPLEKELKMIEDYMGLEKVRYGNCLNLEVEIKGDYTNPLCD